jgi:hypothetical protein
LKRIFFAIFFAVQIITAPLIAQDYYTPAINVVYDFPSQTALTNHINRANANQIKEASKSKSSTTLPSQQYDTNSVVYSPSKSLRKKNLANFVSKTRATDPAGADQMEQLFANGDIISQIDSAIAPYGLTSSNAADAYAVWWVAAWQVANSDTRDVNGATYKAVSAQAARGFATSPEFANATDAQKQEMAEAMLIQAAMIDAAKDNFAGDPAMMKQLATAVKQGAKKSGLDLDTMTLTDEGFAKAKGGKTGAAGDTGKATSPTSEPVATAANDTAPSGDKTTQYALIAAAGGAGLAGMFLFGKAMGKKG